MSESVFSQGPGSRYGHGLIGYVRQKSQKLGSREYSKPKREKETPKVYYLGIAQIVPNLNKC
jgi:hypothetical protein